MRPTVVADRFLRTHRTVIDLATGREVYLRTGPALEGSDAVEWLDACAALSRLRHVNIAPLIDYGLAGADMAFEAYDCAGTYPAAPRLARRLTRTVAEWLRVAGFDLESTSTNAELVHASGAPAALILPAQLSPIRPDEPCEPRTVSAGIRLHAPEAVRRVVEFLEADGRRGIRAVGLQAPPGSGRTSTLAAIAREGRLRGYVPVSIPLLYKDASLREGLADRHLLLLDDPGTEYGSSTHGAVVGGVMLDVALSNRRCHVAVLAHGDRIPVDCALELARLPPFVLRSAAIVCGLTPRRTDAAIERAIDRADGMPGPFVRALEDAIRGWSEGRRAAFTPRRQPPALVRETAAPYGEHDATPGIPVHVRGASTVRIGDALAAALASVRLGLATPGARRGRAAVEALVRRGAVEEGARGACELGAALLEHGQSRDAIQLLRRSRELATLAGNHDQSLLAAGWLGLAWTDAGRLTTAESCLRSARAAAQQTRAQPPADLIRLALARNLYWQGQADEARLLAEPAATDPLQAAVRLRLLARLALARGDLACAGAAAREALEEAQKGSVPAELSSAHGVAATVQAAVGDIAAVRRHVGEGLVMARHARAPLRAIRLRITLLEALRALAPDEYARVGRRMTRRAWERLPGLLRARADLALGDVTGQHGRARRARAFAGASGAKSLGRPSQEATDMSVVQEVVHVLQACHGAEDDATALGRICQTVRERTLASRVVFVAADEAETTVAAAGADSAVAIVAARRAIDARLLIAPANAGGAFEAAAPVQYAGGIIGALACQWPVDALVDVPRTSALLQAAATAAAPALRATLDRLSADRLADSGPDWELIGVSAAIEDVRRAITRATRAPFAVLIEGESGSGKELVARAIHSRSPRRSRRFCAVNCAALPDELFEAELFGHARGAFTGAVGERQGLFEEANGGTLFFDEVGELSPRAQAKLLRVIQEGEVRRLGESFPRAVDTRIVAATNRCLRTEAETGRFRRDLLYRLDVIRVVVPPLRDRPEDLPMLAARFWRDATTRVGSRATLDPETVAALAAHEWPGNVRELQNVLASLAVRGPQVGRVTRDSLPDVLARATLPLAPATLDQARRTFEERFVRAALARAGGHRVRAARELGLTRQGLAKLLKRLGI